MKRFILHNCALLMVITTLAGCSSHCSCPACPVQTQPAQTTIIHEPR